MLGHCSTPPRGQGQFHNGNFAGTVSSTGFLEIFAHEFGTKSCLRDLIILLKVLKIAANAQKIAKSQGTAARPLQPGPVPLWV